MDEKNMNQQAESQLRDEDLDKVTGGAAMRTGITDKKGFRVAAGVGVGFDALAEARAEQQERLRNRSEIG